jgi:PAS domain S-box-containing protein
MKMGDPVKQPLPTSRAEVETSIIRAKTSATILVVEDERLVAKDLQTTLKRLGYSCPVTASSGESALRAADETAPDLVLLDVNLGGSMDGIDVATELRRRRGVPVVFLTAYADDETIGRARLAEPYGYVIKPYNERELRSGIEIALYKHGVEVRRREREAWFSTTLYCIADAVIATDPEGAITFLNAAAERLTPLRALEHMGQPLHDLVWLVTEATGERVPDLVATVLGERIASALPSGLAAVDRDGAREPVEGTIARIADPDGRVLGAVLVFRAIGELRRAEREVRRSRERLAHLNEELEARIEERTRELRETNDELSRASRAKDQFFASMSHELRTPLNGVLGLSEALEEGVYGPLLEAQSRALGRIHDSGRHLLSLISDILDIAKLEAGKLRIDVETVVIEDVCRASLGIVQGTVERKHQRISYSRDERCTRMRANERALKQILVNLLGNAVKFTPTDGTLSLDVMTDPASMTIRFQVSDTGVGIGAQDLERLFRPFVQLDSGPTRARQGSGLGLALAKKLAELHGGTIEAESALGEGSRFTLVMPRWIHDDVLPSED